jgi:probable F420-dependent oxidoreductase
MRVDRRLGICVPFDGVPLHQHGGWFRELEAMGYSDIWSSEVDGTDGLSPLASAAGSTSTARLGTAIVPLFTRGPALLAQSLAAVAEAAPGRFVAGLGASSPTIVSQWNGMTYSRPVQRFRDTLEFLRRAFAGEKIEADFPTFSVHGFRLSRPVPDPPPLFVAALRPTMIRLAGSEGDGLILNWLSASDLPRVLDVFAADKEVVVCIPVLPSADTAAARALARRMIAGRFNVPAYVAYQRWLGRWPKLEKMSEAWAAGDRRGALQAIPDDVVDELVVQGSAEACRKGIAAFTRTGVTPLLSVTPVDVPLTEVLPQLIPAA